jgi:hypothetical protein
MKTINEKFDETIRKSMVKTFLKINNNRGNERLKVLHGFIADLLEEYHGVSVSSYRENQERSKEQNIDGKFYKKNVDIYFEKNNKKYVYNVKFIMNNYSQNSNNYFENMLGETTNLKLNNIIVNQIIILFKNCPYYKSGGKFDR